jgi:hypothetical protein
MLRSMAASTQGTPARATVERERQEPGQAPPRTKARRAQLALRQPQVAEHRERPECQERRAGEATPARAAVGSCSLGLAVEVAVQVEAAAESSAAAALVGVEVFRVAPVAVV